MSNCSICASVIKINIILRGKRLLSVCKRWGREFFIDHHIYRTIIARLYQQVGIKDYELLIGHRNHSICNSSGNILVVKQNSAQGGDLEKGSLPVACLLGCCQRDLIVHCQFVVYDLVSSLLPVCNRSNVPRVYVKARYCDITLSCHQCWEYQWKCCIVLVVDLPSCCFKNTILLSIHYQNIKDRRN
jgi:hypothetical protein